MRLNIRRAEKATGIKTMCNNNVFWFAHQVGNKNTLLYSFYTLLTGAAHFDLKMSS